MELVPTPIALAAPVEKARTVGMRIMTGWTRNAIINSLTSRAVIFIPKYSGVRPDMRPTMKTVRMMNMTMYINPTPFPPGVAWISIPLKVESMTRGFMLDRDALTEPVVTAVVTTVQKTEKKPPKRTSIPGPTAGKLEVKAIKRSSANSAYAPQRMGRLSRFLPINRPNTKQSVVGMSSMRKIWNMSDAGFGFWKG